MTENLSWGVFMRYFLLVLCILFYPALSSAQKVIDGSKNPELIPDSTAYSLLFQALNPGKNENPTLYKARVNGYITDLIGLESLQVEILHNIARQHGAAMQGLYERAKAERAQAPAGAQRNAVIEQERQTTTLGLIEALRTRLDPEGYAKVQKHIAYVKRHTKTLTK